jgi:hypothetical protein
MTPQQRERALEGLQKRIDMIVKKYEVEKEQIYLGNRVSKKLHGQGGGRQKPLRKALIVSEEKQVVDTPTTANAHQFKIK